VVYCLSNITYLVPEGERKTEIKTIRDKRILLPLFCKEDQPSELALPIKNIASILEKQNKTLAKMKQNLQGYHN
jgi:hypothetical protein